MPEDNRSQLKDNLKQLSDNNITDGVLREFVIKGNSSVVIDECNISIAKRFQQIEILRDLKEKHELLLQN